MKSKDGFFKGAGTLIKVVAVVSLTVAPAVGQTSADGGVGARTPDGQPNIQGMWVNFDKTPLEVPIPEDDAVRLKALHQWFPGLQVTATGLSGLGGGLGGGGISRLLGPGDGEGDSSQRSDLRRSLVVDPPSGRVPVRAGALEQRNANLDRLTDSWENHTPWERCITRGVPGGMLPALYSNGYRILQVPGYVVILYEMIHEPRIIPVDGSPHLDSRIRLWNGDSRGRWEGNTLVVELTNYREEKVGTIASSVTSTATLKAIPQSAAMRVVERFTLADAGTLTWEMTVEDTDVYTDPWTVSMPLHRDDEYQMYEYACHEGNYGLENSLSAGRAADLGRE